MDGPPKALAAPVAIPHSARWTRRVPHHIPRISPSPSEDEEKQTRDVISRALLFSTEKDTEEKSTPTRPLHHGEDNAPSFFASCSSHTSPLLVFEAPRCLSNPGRSRMLGHRNTPHSGAARAEGCCCWVEQQWAARLPPFLSSSWPSESATPPANVCDSSCFCKCICMHQVGVR